MGLGIKGLGLKGMGLAAPAPGGLPYVGLDLSQLTFTPAMAKRAINDVFATAPIVQGDKEGVAVPDVISVPNGTIIAGSYFYANYDANQGSLAVRWLPEYSSGGIATGFHYFMRLDNSNYFAYDYPNARYVLRIGAQTMVAVAAVVAGTYANVLFSWDCKNPLDGTNYCRISVNDVHTFGNSAQPTISAPASAIYIGSGGTTGGLCGAIEGLTIFRIPLWDGAYGINRGLGDEVALIAAGIDPTSLYGSFDVTLCFPTDQTAGALVSGNGQAWSHPWADEKLTDSFFSQGYYGGEPWAVKFNGTSTYIDCGSGATLDDIPAGGGVIQVEWWFRCSGVTGNNYVIACKGNLVSSGWALYLNTTSSVYFYVKLATTNVSGVAPSGTYNDNKWHHVIGHYDDATKLARVAVDGRWGSVPVAGVGAYVSDAAVNMGIGASLNGSKYYFTGSLGWGIIHNDAHYTPGTDFIPPHAPPAADVEEWLLNEGTGVTATAQVTVPGNNGTITNGTWEPQWVPEGTPVFTTSLKAAAAGFVADFGSGATVDDLSDGAFSVEGWFLANPGATNRWLIWKGTGNTTGWRCYIDVAGKLRFDVFCATSGTAPISVSRVDDNRWHSFRFTFDDAGDRKGRLEVDTAAVVVGAAAVGAISSDATQNGYIGHASGGFGHQFGWLRLSNVIRTGAVPSRIAPPSTPEANTVAQWNMDDGAGTVIVDDSGNGNTANITSAAGTYQWLNTPETALDSPGSRVFAWGLDIGSDAANDGLKQTLNANLVQNGGFDTDTIWTKAGTKWSIAGGVAHHDTGEVATLSQWPLLGIGLLVGYIYNIKFDVTGRTGGSVQVGCGATYGTARNADGTYTERLVCSTDATLRFLPSNDFHGSIDNVVVTQCSSVIRAIASTGGTYTGQAKLLVRDETNGVDISQLSGGWNYELCYNGDFAAGDVGYTKGTGWTIGGGVADCDGSQATWSYLYQTTLNQLNGGVVVGSLYKVTFTVLNYAAGTISPLLGTAQGPTYSGNGTYTAYIRAVSTGYIYFMADADFDGQIDNISVTRVSEWNQPDILNFSFELPTAARGAAADCTSISIKLLNAAGSGVLTWHQVELLPNLLDNPSLDTGAVADPWIPYGETNNGLDAGDSERETVITHSTGGSFQANVGADAEYISQTVNFVAGKYYSFGIWQYNSASSNTTQSGSAGSAIAKLQFSATLGANWRPTVSTAWKFSSYVGRGIAAGGYNLYFYTAGPAQRYVDDRYLLALTDVALTVTPASYANSLEGTGVRIDGLDAVTQPVGILQPWGGHFAWNTTFRHGAADFLKFGNAAPGLAIIFGDANNFIYIRESAINTIQLWSNLNGVSVTTNWDCTGRIAAGSTHRFDLLYTTSWIMVMFDSASVVFQLVASGFMVGPTLIYIGQNNASLMQADAVFSPPT